MLSNVLEVTFAAVSSSGVSARRGISDASAGRKAVETTEVRIASAYTAAGTPAAADAAIAASVPTRTRSVASMTRRCSCRSAKLAMNGAETAAAPIRANMTRPTAVAPPWWNA